MKLRHAVVAVGAAALVAASSAAAFTPSNPYYAKQWYLAQDRAFDAWTAPPTLSPVKVGIVDSGVDCSLPDIRDQITAARTFVGGSACVDARGHGTIVAGEIAASLGTTGMVGLAYGAQLVVAKVVEPDGTIPLAAEAAGIRWVVDQGARVVNLSFGAVRDPRDPILDTFSTLEARAVAYAYRKGAVVVAAVGNADDAYATPWPYASWPAALPHVVGVAALNRSGDVPLFSDRDRTFVDLAAPGVDIFSTFPVALTALQQGCTPQGYTDCATGQYEHPTGTSFAAPQVSAAAAVLLGIDPTLTNSQVSRILERSADDANASTGCASCANGRDRLSGWGRLDVANAVARVTSGNVPPADSHEPNDNARQAARIWGKRRTVKATLDYWDDPIDVYRVKLGKHERLTVHAHARWPGGRIRLAVSRRGGLTLVASHVSRPSQHLSIRPQKAGWYDVEIRATRKGGGAYALKLRKTPPLRPARHH